MVDTPVYLIAECDKRKDQGNYTVGAFKSELRTYLLYTEITQSCITCLEDNV